MKRNITRYGQVAALCLTLGAQGANACAFHTYAPDPTLVDILLGSETVVLARPDGSGGLRVTRMLFGPEPAGDIHVPIDFPTRGRLAANPSDAVVLARGYDYGPWEMVAYAEPDYLAVIDRIVPHLPRWAVDGEQERLQMFADLLDHANPSVQALALKELDRADYSLLRALDLSHAPTPDSLAESEESLRPIRVLLAGLTGGASAAEMLAAELDKGIVTDSAYLGAYVIALLELEGRAAAHSIADAYLREGSVSIDTREKMLEAFAIQSRAGRPEIGAAVRKVTSEVLADAPALAPAVARQFAFQSDWSQSEALARVVATHPFPEIADVFALNQYIALAQQAGANP